MNLYGGTGSVGYIGERHASVAANCGILMMGSL